jgi:SAM-dependent methyltransferase
MWVELGVDLQLVLADLSAGMVGGAAAGAGAAGLVCDVQHLPFGDDGLDLVVANHMLYHAPSPPMAVQELARVCGPDGTVIAATSGRRHLAELGEIRAEVFGVRPVSDTVAAFGIESGRPMLEARFAEVEWIGYDDELVCTDPRDVVAFLRSVPPGEGASPEQVATMEDAVARRFDAGAGTFRISKETGLFRCGRPRAVS